MPNGTRYSADTYKATTTSGSTSVRNNSTNSISVQTVEQGKEQRAGRNAGDPCGNLDGPGEPGRCPASAMAWSCSDSSNTLMSAMLAQHSQKGNACEKPSDCSRSAVMSSCSDEVSGVPRRRSPNAKSAQGSPA